MGWAQCGTHLSVGTNQRKVQVMSHSQVCGLKWSYNNRQLASGGNDNRLGMVKTFLHKMADGTSTIRNVLADMLVHQSVHAAGSSSRSQLVHRRHGGSPRASPVIDLNEACEPGYEEMEIEEHHGYRAPLGFNKSKRYLMEGDATAGPSQL
ncbi:protein FIZZY-RELATED 2-like [Miscanthus floridulus]|uniref:protein FIZZY-RELATED 2-like n=1 Tax=Miscanthus floridulus TaxID=154761 RepID=UPI003457419F